MSQNGKGDDQRPEARPGLYKSGWENINWPSRGAPECPSCGHVVGVQDNCTEGCCKRWSCLTCGTVFDRGDVCTSWAHLATFLNLGHVQSTYVKWHLRQFGEAFVIR